MDLIRISDGDVYTLPPTLLVESTDFAMKHEQVDLAMADGAKGFGDEVDAGEIEIGGKIWTPSRDAHRTLMDEIRSRLRQPNQRLRMESGYYLTLDKLKDRVRSRWRPLSGKTFTEISATFFCGDPYWYAEDETTATFTPAGNDMLVVDPSLGALPARTWCSPVITITAPPSGSVPSVLLQNGTDAGLQLRYADLQLRNGASVVIDCPAGTVRRTNSLGTVSTIQFLQGQWLRLLAQPNYITYQGAGCTITIRWRARWV